MDAHETEKNCYRLKRSLLWAGWGNTILFLGMMIGACMLEMSGADVERDPKVLIVGSAAFLLGGIYMIAAYSRERMIFHVDRLEQRGVFTRKCMQWKQITAVIWDARVRNGHATVEEGSNRIRISLDTFSPQDRQEIVARLRSSVDESLQEGWGEYQSRWVAKKPRELSRRERRWGAAFFFAVAAVFATGWWLGGGVHLLAYALFNGITGVVILLYNENHRASRRRTLDQRRRRVRAPGLDNVHVATTG